MDSTAAMPGAVVGRISLPINRRKSVYTSQTKIVQSKGWLLLDDT